MYLRVITLNERKLVLPEIVKSSKKHFVEHNFVFKAHVFV